MSPISLVCTYIGTILYTITLVFYPGLLIFFRSLTVTIMCDGGLQLMTVNVELDIPYTYVYVQQM